MLSYVFLDIFVLIHELLVPALPLLHLYLLLPFLFLLLLLFCQGFLLLLFKQLLLGGITFLGLFVLVVQAGRLLGHHGPSVLHAGSGLSHLL